MLNEEKISLMTKLALYEQGEGKKEIPMSGYYRGDYVSLNVVNSAIVGTIAYLLVVVGLVLINVEELLNSLTEIDLIAVGRQILIYYLGFLLIYMIIAYIFYNVKFRTVRNRLNQYNADLKQLYELYKKEKPVAAKPAPAQKVRRKVKPEERTKFDDDVDEELDKILEMIDGEA